MCSLMTTPYFKRVLEDMQSGYQPDQTSSNSMHLRPRTRINEYAVIPGYGALDLESVLPRFKAGIITRLRIWVRRAMKTKIRWPIYDHFGGFPKNVVGRSGWEVTASMRRPTSFGQPIEPRRHLNQYGRWSTAVLEIGQAVWTKNQRARLF